MGLVAKLILSSAAAILGAVFTAQLHAESPPTPVDLLTFERADIKVFREKFLNVDRSFTNRTRAQAERRLNRLERLNRPLEPIDFLVELCRIAALADNAHTGCVSAPLAREICRQFAILDGGNSSGCVLGTPDFNVPKLNRVAIEFFAFGSDFYVVSTKPTDSDLLGARLLNIDGKSISGIRKVLRTFSGGTIAWRDLLATDVLVSPNQLRSVGITRLSDALTYRFVTSSGRIVEREFKVAEGVADGVWKRIPSPERAQWAFQEQAKDFRWRDAPELDAVVIQLRKNIDSANKRIADFLEEAESNRERLGRANVVLDMRFNGGGNLMLTRDFMTNWPARVSVPGRFYVLTARQTFSAGIASIAYLKQSGKDRVVLVGEAPGDRLMFFSEGRPIQLPHSGLFFRPSTARTDFHMGCRTYDDCFVGIAQPGRLTAPLNFASIRESDVPRKPVAVASLEPDIQAPWTVESWLMGTDPAMAAVAVAIGKEQ